MGGWICGGVNSGINRGRAPVKAEGGNGDQLLICRGGFPFKYGHGFGGQGVAVKKAARLFGHIWAGEDEDRRAGGGAGGEEKERNRRSEHESGNEGSGEQEQAEPPAPSVCVSPGH
jgi:hypothetical protein